MVLPRVYPIVASAEWVRRLLPQGVRLVQLRVKDQPAEAVRAEIRDARRLCARAGAQLIVNDYWQLALDEDCDFVHLGQGDLEGADIASLRRAGVRIGVSTHDPAELERALAVAADYVALGPVYPSLLKVMPWAPQGLERLAEWKRRVGRIALVAIGGLTVERLPGVFAAGADVAAVVTDIVRNPHPEARARQWLEAAAAVATPSVEGAAAAVAPAAQRRAHSEEGP
ncbi:MAG: thiamine phosphate synthase [Steroidobacteraceae bacterium]